MAKAPRARMELVSIVGGPDTVDRCASVECRVVSTVVLLVLDDVPDVDWICCRIGMNEYQMSDNA